MIDESTIFEVIIIISIVGIIITSVILVGVIVLPFLKKYLTRNIIEWRDGIIILTSPQNYELIGKCEYRNLTFFIFINEELNLNDICVKKDYTIRKIIMECILPFNAKNEVERSKQICYEILKKD